MAQILSICMRQVQFWEKPRKPKFRVWPFGFGSVRVFKNRNRTEIRFPYNGAHPYPVYCCNAQSALYCMTGHYKPFLTFNISLSIHPFSSPSHHVLLRQEKGRQWRICNVYRRIEVVSKWGSCHSMTSTWCKELLFRFWGQSAFWSRSENIISSLPICSM